MVELSRRASDPGTPGAPLARIAHRGLPAKAPENTLTSFRWALQTAAQSLELDVRASSDGHLVVVHDPDLWRVARVRAAVRTLTLEELRRVDLGGGERVPTYEEVLDLVPPAMCVTVDIKETGLEERVLTALRERGLEERTTLSSFTPSVLRELARRGTAARLSISYPEDRLGVSARPVVRHIVPAALRVMRARLPRTARHLLRASGAGILSLYHPLLSQSFIRDMGRDGVPVVAWTVNDAARAVQLAQWGVAGIVSDEPAVLEALATAAGAGDEQHHQHDQEDGNNAGPGDAQGHR